MVVRRKKRSRTRKRSFSINLLETGAGLAFLDAANAGSAAQQMIKGMYEEAGYQMPDIVYWNIQSRNDNCPTRFDESGTALVSGFSPSIMRSILSCKNITPYEVMMETIDSPRYEAITI